MLCTYYIDKIRIENKLTQAIQTKQIIIYADENDREPFRNWIDDLKDKTNQSTYTTT